MNDVTIHMVTRARHNEMAERALDGGEGYTIYVQGWLPRQWTRLRNFISPAGQQADNSARRHDVAHNAG